MFTRIKFLRDQFSFNPKVIYDIGAYEGKWTEQIKEIYPNSVVYQFEANKDKQSYLDPKHSFMELLSSSNDIVTYYKTQSSCGTGNSIFKENSYYFSDSLLKKEYIESKRLDDLIKTHNIPLPDFIKIDTQGSELKILKGFSKYIKDVPIILLEISLHQYNHNGPLLDDVTKYMSSIGFIMIDIVDLHYNKNVLIQIDAIFANRLSDFVVNKF